MKPKSLPSRLFDMNSAAASGESPSSRAAKYQRHVDCVDHSESVDQSSCEDGEQATDDSGEREKWHREIHFAFSPERYVPLMDDEAKAKAKEEKKKRKKANYKKVKKPVIPFLHHFFSCLERSRQWISNWSPAEASLLANVGKALRITWKCLMLGLHNFALGYSAPITVAATFVPDFHLSKNRT